MQAFVANFVTQTFHYPSLRYHKNHKFHNAQHSKHGISTSLFFKQTL